MASQLAIEFQAERRRLSDQCALILGRLQQGRVSNKELSGMALIYTARLTELRKMGHDVRLVYRDRLSGLTQYALFVNGLEWGVEVH